MLQLKDHLLSSRLEAAPTIASIRQPLESRLPVSSIIPHPILILMPLVHVQRQMFQIAGADVLLLPPLVVFGASERKVE